MLNEIKLSIVLLDKALKQGQIKIDDLKEDYLKNTYLPDKYYQKSLQEYLDMFIERKEHFEDQMHRLILDKKILRKDQLAILYDEVRIVLNKSIIWM